MTVIMGILCGNCRFVFVKDKYDSIFGITVLKILLIIETMIMTLTQNQGKVTFCGRLSLRKDRKKQKQKQKRWTEEKTFT